MNANGAKRRLAGLAAAAVLMSSVAGCNQPTGNVSGVVRYKGDPLPGGRITFYSADKSREPLSALLKEDGSYTITGCPVGTATLTVETFRRADPSTAPPGAGIKPPGGDAPQGKYVPIPTKYSSPETSGLSCPVTTGGQPHDVDLTD